MADSGRVFKGWKDGFTDSLGSGSTQDGPAVLESGWADVVTKVKGCLGQTLGSDQRTDRGVRGLGLDRHLAQR